MTKIDVAALTGAHETLLIPLWARAEESRRAEPMLVDRKALEIVDSVDYDFEKFRARKVSPVNYCSRALVMDRVVQGFLRRWPGGTVVEIGPGLDGRFERLDNGQVRWFDLDVPEVIDVRRRFYAAGPRRSFLPFSVTDPAWLPLVEETRPRALMLVAEGVFYFLAELELRALFTRLADAFAGVRVVFDSQSPLYLMWSRLWHPLQNSSPRWSLRDARQIERWDPRFHVEESVGFGDSPHYDAHMKRFPAGLRLVRKLCPPVRRMFVVNAIRLGESRTP